LMMLVVSMPDARPAMVVRAFATAVTPTWVALDPVVEVDDVDEVVEGVVDVVDEVLTTELLLPMLMLPCPSPSTMVCGGSPTHRPCLMCHAC